MLHWRCCYRMWGQGFNAASPVFTANYRVTVQFRLTVYDSRSVYLPLLSNTLTLFLEICKRSVRVIIKCLFSSSSLVPYVVLNSLYVRFFNSFIYRNLCVICKNFGWLVDDCLVFECWICVIHCSVITTGILYLLLYKKWMTLWAHNCVNLLVWEMDIYFSTAAVS